MDFIHKMCRRLLRILSCWALVTALTVCLSVPTGYAVPAAPDEGYSPPLRVGLMTRQTGILAGSNGPFDIFNADDGKLVGEFAAGAKARIGLRDGSFVVNNAVVSADRLRIVSRRPKGIEREDRLLDLNNRRYRGSIEIFRTQGAAGMTAVNLVNTDEYLYGVLTRALTPEWPEQAVKAQAVAARTFALHFLGKHKEEGFDLCDTNDCMVYEGQTREDARIWKAIDATRGLVLVYQGYPIAAHIHLSGGGYTENSENVFGKMYPYLRGVKDSDQTSPYFRWQKRLTPQELEQVLKDAGIGIGALSAVEVSRRTPPPVADSSDRGVSGRVRTITFIGKDGVASLTGEKFRSILSLPGTLFDLNVVIPAGSFESSITDSYGDRENKQIQINLPPQPAGGLLTDRPGIRRITGQKNETIFIDGNGWGHGVGLSQWGAKTMAEMAINPAPDYYVTILKHYFQGVSIDKWY